MTIIDDRFDRNIRLFGAEGQRRLRNAHVAVVGVGGLGSHVVQQLALLGVGAITFVDDEELSTSNKNRYIGARFDDPVPSTPKVEIAARLAHSIDPSIKTTSIFASLLSAQAFDALKNVDSIFGCFDSDGPRFVLNDISTAYAEPYFDLASDVSEGKFGGRVLVNWKGDGCLFCLNELDKYGVQMFLENRDERTNREAAYGIPRRALDQVGPSVVSVNGVIASLAVTEYMAACTGLRSPAKFLNYDGAIPRVLPRRDPLPLGCPYCSQWGSKSKADVDRYLRHSRDI